MSWFSNFQSSAKKFIDFYDNPVSKWLNPDIEQDTMLLKTWNQVAGEHYRENRAKGMTEGQAVAHTLLPDSTVSRFADQLAEREGKPSNVVQSILNGDSSSSGNSSGHTVRTGTTAKPITYSEWSPAAQHFSMDQATAYAEHMANTAHQREVADLRAAGLNPVLGLGSGASGVSGSVASSVGSGYSGSSSAKKDNGKLIDALGATTAVIATLVTKNPTTGGMIGTAVKALGKAFDD